MFIIKKDVTMHYPITPGQSFLHMLGCSNVQDTLDQSVDLQLDDCTIRVEMDEPVLREKLLRYFKPFLIQNDDQPHIVIKALENPPLKPGISLTDLHPGCSKKRIKEQYINIPGGRVVRKKLSGMLFFMNSGENIAIGPCTDNDNQIVNFINNRFIQWKLDQGCLLCHAAAVSRKGQGIILAGFSGLGKSTLALHLMNKGLDFVSNDRLMVRKKKEHVEMFGVAKLPRVNPGTILYNPRLTGILTSEEIRKFSGISKDMIWKMEHKYDVWLDKCFGRDRFKLQSGVKALVILNWSRHGQSLEMQRVNLEKRSELLQAVIKSPGLFYYPSDNFRVLEPDPLDYMKFFQDIPVYELGGGIDFQQASDRCAELI